MSPGRKRTWNMRWKLARIGAHMDNMPVLRVVLAHSVFAELQLYLFKFHKEVPRNGPTTTPTVCGSLSVSTDP